MRRLTSVVSVVVILSAASCARGLYGPSIDTPAGSTPRELDELSGRDRRALLDSAVVWRAIDTGKLDLLAGPRAKDGFAPDQQVTCAFHYPDEPLGGVTPKFECRLGEDDVVKVKYGEDNGEVYAEVAASRLLWALGFFADRMYPVSVTCVGCPKTDPFRVSATEWDLGKPGNVITRVFDPATIERQVEGKDIEVDDFEGWSWKELESVADNTLGAPRAQVDGFKLLAAFIQHVDSKPENQAMLCADEDVREDQRGNERCAQPLLMIKDLGSTFADASRFRFRKMHLASWRAVSIWRDTATCTADLTSSLVGTLSNPVISEAGRRFLAERLSRLSDAQLRDLFTAARVERRNETIDGRAVTVGDWVQAFKAKRAEIVNHRCPT